MPSTAPSGVPSALPSSFPSGRPSGFPSARPSALPSAYPSAAPSRTPTGVPSGGPTAGPSAAPTSSPTSSHPTGVPSTLPTAAPSGTPTTKPTGDHPTSSPTIPQAALSAGASEPAASDNSALIGSLAGVLGAVFCAILIYYGYTQYKDRQTEQDMNANLSPYERWMQHQEKGRGSMGLSVGSTYDARHSTQSLSYDDMYRNSYNTNPAANGAPNGQTNYNNQGNANYMMSMAGIAGNFFVGQQQQQQQQQGPPRESLGDDHMDMTDIYGRNSHGGSSGRNSTGVPPNRFSQGNLQGNTGPDFALGEFRGSMGNPMNSPGNNLGRNQMESPQAMSNQKQFMQQAYLAQQQRGGDFTPSKHVYGVNPMAGGGDYQDEYKESGYDYPATMNGSTHNPMMGNPMMGGGDPVYDNGNGNMGSMPQRIAPSPRHSFQGSMGGSPLQGQGVRRPSMRDRRMSANSQQYDNY